MTDDKTRQLENRIDKLESTIEKMMPSRRDALKMGGAALVGGAAMSGTASAGTNQVGTIGTPNDLVDIESEDINNADTISTQDLDIQQDLNGADTSTASAGEALTSNGSGGLIFASAGGGIPANFSYQNVTSNRSFNNTFTNNTGKALFVSVTAKLPSAKSQIRMEGIVNGKEITQKILRPISSDYAPNTVYEVQFFVPDGATYECVNFGGDLELWFEAEM